MVRIHDLLRLFMQKRALIQDLNDKKNNEKRLFNEIMLKFSHKNSIKCALLMWDNHMKTLDYFDNIYSQECHALFRKQKPFKFYIIPSHHFLRMHIPPKTPDIYIYISLEMSLSHLQAVCSIII